MKSNANNLLSTDSHLLCVTQPEALPYLRQITHVYTDLDSTMLAPGGKLLTRHDGTPSYALAEALIELKNAGIEIIIVTGRNGAQGDEFLRLLDLGTFIGEVGCMVQEGFGVDKKLLYELGDWTDTILVDGLGPGELPDGITPYQLMQNSGVIDRLTDAFFGKLELHTPYPTERTVTYALRGLVDADKVESFLDKEALPLELADNGEIHPQKHTLIDCPEIHIYHLVPRGTSKALAVKADIKRRGLTCGQTLAIGDAKGDVEMGDHAGALVVMGNALHSKTVQEALENRIERAHNEGWDATTLFTSGFTSDGWVEFAHALLLAQKT